MWSKAKKAIYILIFAIVLEQSFLYFYLNGVVSRQDEIFFQHIKSLGEPKYTYTQPFGRRAYDCQWYPIAVIYKFKVCVVYARPNEIDGKDTFTLFVVYPPAYLTLISWDYGDREIIDRQSIFHLDFFKNIIADRRKDFSQ